MSSLAYNKDTAVLFLIFNRPDTTAVVFEAIRKAQPTRLYVSADGPRSEAEHANCEQARSVIAKVDWECEVFTNFSTHNKGCKVAISDGITWFFQQEEEGIVLEDDCLPSVSFFSFCSSMLAHYRHDQRITHIAGCNLQLGEKRGDASYFFSNLTHVWGWAGWRRVWAQYDVNMSSFPAFKSQEQLNNCLSHLPFKENWLNALEKTYNGEINTWDYQYAYLNMCASGMSVIPNVNLISNIGFGAQATHTMDQSHNFAALPNEELTTLTHPEFMIASVEADLYAQEKAESTVASPKKNILSRTWKRIKSS